MADLPIEDAQALVRALVQLARMADRALPANMSGLSKRLQDHLGSLEGSTPNTSISLPPIDRANLQLALDAYAASADTWEVIGLSADIGNYSGLSLLSLVAGAWHGPSESAAQYVSVEIGTDETIDCLRAGLILTELDDIPLAVLVYIREHGMPELVVEVVAARQEAADGFVAALRVLLDEHNSFRGKVISFSFGIHGQFGITFVSTPSVPREHVVLADGDLEAIEEHAIGISYHAAALVAAGQHVRRGLLLYGPPGTGKTHTISYLLGRMIGRTTIILSGAAVGAVGQAGTIAKRLQPATIVIEDVDLIGMDRGLPGGDHNSMLFQLLNEMDGLGDDADVLFILTTNRVEMLEPALTARPGRIDQAMEIGLPNAAARRRLVELYARGLPDVAEGDRLVARLEGVAPAFIKELARRATMLGLRQGRPAPTCLHDALDAMLHQSAPILRRSLAAQHVEAPIDAER